MREAVPHEEQGLVRQAGDGLGEAVPEVESRPVPALSEALKGVHGFPPVRLAEGDHFHAVLLYEAAEEGSGVHGETRSQHDPRLREGRRTHPDDGGTGEGVEDLLVARMPE